MLTGDGRTVVLDALWNEGEPGHMKVFKGLVHKFSRPTTMHFSKLSRANSRRFITSRNRATVTRLPSPHITTIELYDELIQSVEGYGVDGRALLTRDEIIREMDSFHKSAAVMKLFPSDIDIEVAGESKW